MVKPRRLPIGYFLTAGRLSSKRQANLVQVLERLTNCSTRVRALVFDGTAANIGTANGLGAQLPDRTNFPHPKYKDWKVYVILDNCHMLKLVAASQARHNKRQLGSSCCNLSRC